VRADDGIEAQRAMAAILSLSAELDGRLAEATQQFLAEQFETGTR
jgi:hypothetical protein